jgi:hypothetical protein
MHLRGFAYEINVPPWVEVPVKAHILNKPSHGLMPALGNNATFLTHDSG